jgi:hypothetical protein
LPVAGKPCDHPGHVGLAQGAEAKHVMALYWRDADLLRVERQPPAATGTGKILHLHRLPAGAAGA